MLKFQIGFLSLLKWIKIVCNLFRWNLIETTESYCNCLIFNYKDAFRELAQSYYEYREYLSKQEEKKKDFHGLRDFYQLIKVICKNL